MGLVAFLLYLHATENSFLLHRFGSVWGIIFLYAGPLIAGGILLLFMTKPLFAGRSRREKTRPLHPAREALLFAFVTRIARAVGAPEPKRIEVDWSVNASASLGEGLAGFWGRSLTLTIGVPLVAGFTIQELAGVLAHELGHFTQGSSMRLHSFIYSMNAWLGHIVYERDGWDEALEDWCADSGRLALIFYLARLCIRITRWILWFGMVLSHALSCFLARQSEYDADRFATHLIGSAAYEKAFLKLARMDATFQGAESLFFESLMNGNHLQDLPSLIAQGAEQLPPKVRRKIEKRLQQNRTALFDTHPAHPDRIASIRRAEAAGIFHLDRPATELFSDYEKLAQSVTADLYRKAVRYVPHAGV
jgi:Zn-dependent protease with chaperone function